MKAAIAVVLVFVGCCCNVVFLELLVKDDPGIGNLITFAQFLFIAMEGVIFTSKFFTVKPVNSIKDYSIMVAFFFLTNVCNNYAFDFNIPMPLHMIFRAGSLITNMIMAIIILKKRYPMSKYVSVGMITMGIAICTIMSGKEVKSTATRGPPTTHVEDLFWWSVGIFLLIFALFVSARLGIYQEVLYTKHGKHPREAMFYTHLLPIPGFFLLYSNIYEHLQYAVESAPVEVLWFQVPKTLLYLLGNVLTQYLCISSVFVLTTECSSLTVNLVITLRKFFSLIFSIIYFKNALTIYHWLGIILVFVGTYIFTEIHDKIVKSMTTRTGKVRKVE